MLRNSLLILIFCAIAHNAMALNLSEVDIDPSAAVTEDEESAPAKKGTSASKTESDKKQEKAK